MRRSLLVRGVALGVLFLGVQSAIGMRQDVERSIDLQQNVEKAVELIRQLPRKRTSQKIPRHLEAMKGRFLGVFFLKMIMKI